MPRPIHVPIHIATLVSISLSGCIEPIPTTPGSSTPGARTAVRSPSGTRENAWIGHTFFDEDFQQGGYTFAYGGSSKISSVEGNGADSSEFLLHASLDPSDYSGVAVCLWNMAFDLSPFRKTGALVLQVRGKTGGENVTVGLADDEKTAGWKSVVRVPLSRYGTIRKDEWTTFVIPLRDLGKRGVAWDAAHGVEIPKAFQWDRVEEFRILANKGDNKECEVDVDNVRIWADALAPLPDSAQPVDWLDLDTTLAGPSPSEMELPDPVAATFFEDDLPPGGSTYGYPAKSCQKTLASSTPGNPGVWALYMENDYAGVTLSLDPRATVDLSAIRKAGSLSFWILGGASSEKFMVGLLDDQGGQKKVHTKVIGNDWVAMKKGRWALCRIPLRAFSEDGTFWDEAQKHEVSAKMDWSRIEAFRISISRDENKPEAGKPVAFYLDRIRISKGSTGIFDPDVYWDGFRSDAPEEPLTDFTRWADKWKAVHGQTADLEIAVVSLPKGAPVGMAGKAFRMDFRPGDWYETMLQLPNAPGIPTDWTHHYALSFWLFSEKPYQLLDVTLQDRDHEYFTARVGAAAGWHRVVLPFRNFSKFPYYQPPEAVANNRLDLENVHQIGFKPGGEIAGSLRIADIALTNLRETPKATALPVMPATFRGSLTKSVQPIADLYGANLEQWMSEALEPVAMDRLKALHPGVLRYPGGLHSDDEDWKKTLAAKDGDVDTDEFLDWCAAVGAKPMITVNVGSGTVELAADWVRHTNVGRKKAPRVEYWELGNELYGKWNRYFDKFGMDGGTAYGKAAREFILAMKAVDPSIKVTVIWMLTGDWNRVVFKEVADVVDGVNVHHYAQISGSENDEGLLAVSSESDKLMEDVRRQVEAYGIKGRHYDIWLTEWNSVDFNPGPQILSQTEALYVADYLGHLAKSPVQISTFWGDIHNGRELRRGDYGLLAAKGDPDGSHARRPAYWALDLLSNALVGTLLEGGSDQDLLSSWLARRADGKASLVFVNKNPDSDYRTVLRVPGLSGEAEVRILTASNSGEGPGPATEVLKLGDGSAITIPKYSVVTVRFR